MAAKAAYRLLPPVGNTRKLSAGGYRASSGTGRMRTAPRSSPLGQRHTSEHCDFYLPERDVLITGDALITAHPAARPAPSFVPDVQSR